MKTLRIVVTCAVALVVGHAWAQDQTTPANTAQAAQDVGGMTDMSRGDAGSVKGITRQQVYQDLVRSEQSGQQRQLQEGLYHGN
jgi:hypothetical protein